MSEEDTEKIEEGIQELQTIQPIQPFEPEQVPDYKVLSIDIGTKNFGSTLITYTKGKWDFQFECQELKYSHSGTVEGRYKALKNFFDGIDMQSLDAVVIEKQVPGNQVAMCLMYALYAMTATMIGEKKVVLFTPSLKFLAIGANYNTASKNHKKQSVTYAKNMLKQVNKDALSEFNNFKKQDDVADSMNQGIVFMLRQGWANLTVERVRDMFGVTNFSSGIKLKEK